MRDSEREFPLLFGWECHGEQANKMRFFCLGIGYGMVSTGKW